MSTEPSRKREGDQLSDDPSSKVPVVDSSVAPHDVVLIVKGQKFYCLKEKLAKHSTYFEGMFFKEFSEKDKKEVEIGELRSDVFQLFIDALNGINSITDEYSEVALVAAIFLGSSTLEDKILQHFAENSEISLKEQFNIAEDHESDKLMIQVCASIKDAYELDEVVPKDLDSFCNRTKNLVLQRSFELLGIRKPPSPPLPEEPDQLFEHMMNQIIDQVDIQNHHGEILLNQVRLVHEHLFFEKLPPTLRRASAQIIRDNPLIKELIDELRKAHDHEEANFIQAQILVLKYKDMYTAAHDPELIQPRIVHDLRNICDILHYLKALIHRNKPSLSPFRTALGDREIDRMYRDMPNVLDQDNSVFREFFQDEFELFQCVNNRARWIGKLCGETNNILHTIIGLQGIPRPMPNGLRQVSDRATFLTINGVVMNLRNLHYLVPRHTWED
ncbi:unnamed protein product [Caenorhabditis brenneri]